MNKLSLLLYRLGVHAYFLAAKFWAFFNTKAKKFVEGRTDIFETITTSLQSEKRKRIWMHCASLGEFEQGRPVLESFQKARPDCAIVLTFFSPSGFEAFHGSDVADYIFYLPKDTPANAKLFLQLVKPEQALFVKYDLWFFYLSELKKQKIPSVLFSAVFHKYQNFFKWYGGLQRKMLKNFSQIFVQDEDSLELLNTIGLFHVQVSGDTRYDRVLDVSNQHYDNEIIRHFMADKHLIVAGSTWPSDWKLIEEAFPKLREKYNLIVAPHELSEDVDDLLPFSLLPFSQTYSNYDFKKSKDVLVLNTLHQLNKVYRYAAFTYVGGGFEKSGVHNVLEPVVYGKLVFIGSRYQEYREAVQLVKNGAAISVINGEQLYKKITQFESQSEDRETLENKAKAIVMTNAGATQKVVDYLLSNASFTKRSNS